MVNLDLKVLAVVVTYNRLKCLKNCVSALRKQTYKCVDIMVVNNGSNDGTAEWLHGEKGLFVIYQNNCGGAGGFYAGMQTDGRVAPDSLPELPESETVHGAWRPDAAAHAED